MVARELGSGATAAAPLVLPSLDGWLHSQQTPLPCPVQHESSLPGLIPQNHSHSDQPGALLGSE